MARTRTVQGQIRARAVPVLEQEMAMVCPGQSQGRPSVRPEQGYRETVAVTRQGHEWSRKRPGTSNLAPDLTLYSIGPDLT